MSNQSADQLTARLLTMLAYRRPSGSPTESAFCNRWLAPMGAVPDTWGNWILPIGSSRVLWSAHLDTVHDVPGHSRIRFDGQIARAHRSILGADDTAGCFLLLELARRHIPGVYVWHAGEEIGCVGSAGLVADSPDWLDAIDIVIALDRRGTNEVITHQMCRRTCSTAFATDLAKQLTDSGLPYHPSDHGLYTDSDSYASVAAECTNLSVGYDREHSERETLNVHHVLRLLDSLSHLDVSKLSIARDPLTVESWGTGYDTLAAFPSRHRCSWENLDDWPTDDNEDPDTPLAVDVAALQRQRRRSVWLYDDVRDVQDALASSRVVTWPRMGPAQRNQRDRRAS